MAKNELPLWKVRPDLFKFDEAGKVYCEDDRWRNG